MGGKGGVGGRGGGTTQALYAHMNNKTIKNSFSLLISFTLRSLMGAT
jgi:hypothetical protein